MTRAFRLPQACLLAWLLGITSHAVASGVAIDKIYTPYVDAMGYELEYRLIGYEDTNKRQPLDDNQIHKLGFGASLSDRWFGELYLLGSNTGNAGFSTDGYEAEVRWQATEQGEYPVDVGMQFELERELGNDEWEATAALLLTKEVGRFMATANLDMIMENKKATGSESEMAANGQLLYRFTEQFEPAIEIYRAQDTFGIGPMLTGTARLSPGKKLHWEFGIIKGLVRETPDTTIKGLLEFEF